MGDEVSSPMFGSNMGDAAEHAKISDFVPLVTLTLIRVMFSQFWSKIMVRGIVVTSTVLRTERIPFRQNMQMEHNYQTAISDFEFLKKTKIGENYHIFYIFQHNFLNFQKTGM